MTADRPTSNAATADLTIFVAIRTSSAAAFDALDAGVLEDGLDRAMNQYPDMLPPDLLAVTLRKLGIKCKTLDDPALAGHATTPVPSNPGFRSVLVRFPGARRIWLDA